jgi:hypothetical protein
MATYGYSTPYTGQQVQTLPPGYLEAATAPGRNLAMGIAAMGQGLGKAIEQYRTKKAETEAATQSWETVSGLMQQQLASDPKYLAIQQYMETGALPQGVTEQDIPRYTQQVQADREMLNKFSALGEKFSDMSLAKKKAALGDAVMVLNQYRTDQQNQVREALTQQQLALGALQLQQAQREAAAAPYFTQALGEVMSRPQGQGPSAPYANVTSELIDKYGDKLTPAQMQALIPMLRKSEQTIPAGLVPIESKAGPGGIETTYGAPPSVTSMPIPGTDLVQPMVGPKPSGAPVKASPKILSEIDKLPEAQQKWANDTLSDVNKNPQIKAVGEQFKNLAEIKELGTTPSDDIALIFKYMKTLDPNSVVRETEFQTVGNAGGLPTQIQNIYNSYTTGNKLTPEIRRDIKKSADSVVRGSLKSVESTISDFVNQAKYRGVPEKLILPETSLKAWRSLSAQSTAESLQRFQSPEDMRARGIKRGLVFNPATGKYQEFQD